MKAILITQEIIYFYNILLCEGNIHFIHLIEIREKLSVHHLSQTPCKKSLWGQGRGAGTFINLICLDLFNLFRRVVKNIKNV